jgi:hypothetical protein
LHKSESAVKISGLVCTLAESRQCIGYVIVALRLGVGCAPGTLHQHGGYRVSISLQISSDGDESDARTVDRVVVGE